MRPLEAIEARQRMNRIFDSIKRVLEEYIEFAKLEEQLKEKVLPVKKKVQLNNEIRKLIEEKFLLAIKKETGETDYEKIEAAFKSNIERANKEVKG